MINEFLLHTPFREKDKFFRKVGCTMCCGVYGARGTIESLEGLSRLLMMFGPLPSFMFLCGLQ